MSVIKSFLNPVYFNVDLGDKPGAEMEQAGSIPYVSYDLNLCDVNMLASNNTSLLT